MFLSAQRVTIAQARQFYILGYFTLDEFLEDVRFIRTYPLAHSC